MHKMNIRAYLLIPVLALSLCTARAQKLAGGDISMLPRYEQAGATYYTHDGQPVSDLIAMLNKHNKVNGLFWWWPEYNAKDTSLSGWYNAALFDSRTGRATSAFTALGKYATTSAGISQLKANTSETTDDRYYDLSGRSVSQPKDSGVYIQHQKKIIVR